MQIWQRTKFGAVFPDKVYKKSFNHLDTEKTR